MGDLHILGKREGIAAMIIYLRRREDISSYYTITFIVLNNFGTSNCVSDSRGRHKRHTTDFRRLMLLENATLMTAFQAILVRKQTDEVWLPYHAKRF